MELTSKAITEGQEIPLQYAEPGAGGQNTSPDLAWSGAPEGTKSFAVTVYDPDAPTGSGFWHWVLADLPPDVTSLPEGGPVPDGAREWVIDYGYRGYGGACPPPGPAHRYIHTVHALSVDKLPVPDDATNTQARFAIHTNELGRASITGLFALPEQAQQG